jgi:hypothetical protein
MSEPPFVIPPRKPWYERLKSWPKAVGAAVAAVVAGVALLGSNVAAIQTAYWKLKGVGELTLKIADPQTGLSIPFIEQGADDRGLGPRYTVEVTVSKAFDVPAKHCFLDLDFGLQDSDVAEFRRQFNIERGISQVRKSREFAARKQFGAMLFVKCDGAISNGLRVDFE